MPSDNGNDTSAAAQTCQVDEGINTKAMTVMMPMWHEGKEVSTIRTTTQGQQGQYNACAVLAMAPAQRGQQCHSYDGTHWWQWQSNCYKGNNLSLMTMLAWLRQRRHLDKGNNHLQRWQRCLHINGNNAIESNNHHCNNSEDHCGPIAVNQLLSSNCHRRCRCHTTLTKASLLSEWQCVLTEFSYSLDQRSTLRTTIAAANHNNRNQASAIPTCPLSIRLIAVLSGARLLESHHHCRPW